MLEVIISLYAPHHCLQCNAEGVLLCEECRGALPASAGRCYRCHALSPSGRTCVTCRHRSKLYAVQSVTDYDGLAKQLIGRLKFSGARAAARLIAEEMEDFVIWPEVLIVHLPTASNRIRLRGYDQAAYIAKSLANNTRVEYLPALLRHGQHRQVGASRQERFRQMEDSFIVRNPAEVAGRHVILVDDVMTTGASLECAAAVLKTAGAKRVEAVVFARA